VAAQLALQEEAQPTAIPNERVIMQKTCRFDYSQLNNTLPNITLANASGMS